MRRYYRLLKNYSAMGYALVDADGNPVNIESPRTLNDQIRDTNTPITAGVHSRL